MTAPGVSDTLSIVPPPVAGPVARTFAGLAGLVVLGLGTLVTLGGALVGALGVGIAYWFVRRRGQRATLTKTWIGAAATSAVAIALVIAVATSLTPSGTLTKAMAEASDSVKNAPPRNQPEWLRRMADRNPPNAAVDSQVKNLTGSTAFMGYMMVMVMGLASMMLGVMTGTVGWAGMTLLLFGVRGYWGDSFPRRALSS